MAKPLQIVVTVSNSNISVAGALSPNPDQVRKDSQQFAQSPGLGGVFESVSDGTSIAVRHRPSGLLCYLAKVAISPKAERPSRFDPTAQSGCATIRKGHQADLMVVPNDDHVSLGEAMKSMVAQVKTEQPAIEELAGRRTDPARGYARFLLSSGDEPRYMSFILGLSDHWVVMAKTRCVYAQAGECDALAETVFTEAIKTVH